jgi:hypothetical protein
MSSWGLPFQQDIKHWLSWLRTDVGFDGWRFDFAKGYNGQHVLDYIKATQPALAVGEYWDDCCYTDSHLEYDQVWHPRHSCLLFTHTERYQGHEPKRLPMPRSWLAAQH